MAGAGENRLKEIIARLDPEVDRAIRAVLETSVVPMAKALAPWDPGTVHLKDRIHIERHLEGFYIVGGDKEAWYGHIVEYGTARRSTRNRPNRQGHDTGTMPRQPFLNPAFEANRQAIIDAARAAIKRACS
jgi:HK97 gp10 family phage protein